MDDHGEETVPEAQGERYERSGRYGQESFVKRRERENQREKAKRLKCRLAHNTGARTHARIKNVNASTRKYLERFGIKNLAFYSRLRDMMCVCVCVCVFA